MSYQPPKYPSIRGQGGPRNRAPPRNAPAGTSPPYKIPRVSLTEEEKAKRRVKLFIATAKTSASTSSSWRVGAQRALRVRDAPHADALRKRLELEERLATSELDAAFQRHILGHALKTQVQLNNLEAAREKRLLGLGEDGVKTYAAVAAAAPAATTSAAAPAADVAPAPSD